MTISIFKKTCGTGHYEHYNIKNKRNQESAEAIGKTITGVPENKF